MSYGVSGRELEIEYPMYLKRGLFGCYNLFFGPAHSLVIPKELAQDLVSDKFDHLPLSGKAHGFRPFSVDS